MKKTLLVLAILFASLSLFAQQPLVKFYLQDGSTKSYNIQDVGNISFIKAEISSLMTVFNKVDSLTRYFDVSNINSIQFDSNKIKINLTDTTVYQALAGIDSIIIKQKAQRVLTVWINKNLTCLNQLRVSSFADYNKKFDAEGKTRLKITNNGLPQIIMISDSANNLIAIGLAISTDTTVFINGISTISGMVFQNANIMGMTTEQGVDSVVNFIRNLGEVLYVSSFIENSINTCIPLKSVLDSNLKPILRVAYVKTYEYSTRKTFPFGLAMKGKEASENLLNENLPVIPEEASGITVTAEKDNNNDIWVTVTNKRKRHINVRESDESHLIYRLGPNEPIMGKILCVIWDKIMHEDHVNFKKEDGFMPIHTLGLSTNIYNKVTYPNLLDYDFRRNGIGRTVFSVWLAAFETGFSELIKLDRVPENKKVEFVYNVLSLAIAVFPSFMEAIERNDIIEAASILSQELAQQSDNIQVFLFDLGFILTLDQVKSLLPVVTSIIFSWDFLDLVLNELRTIDEYSIFNVTSSGKDVTPPKVEVISPLDRFIKSNSMIDLSVKVTDDQWVKKIKYYLDYSKFPFHTIEFSSQSKEQNYTFKWDNSGYIGMHYLTVDAEDASGNSSNIMKTYILTPNPNDNIKPTVEITDPAGSEVELLAKLPVTVHATDNELVSAMTLYLDEIFIETKEFGMSSDKDVIYTFYVNTINFKPGEKHLLRAYDLDANLNAAYVEKEIHLKSSVIRKPLAVSLCLDYNSNMSNFKDATETGASNFINSKMTLDVAEIIKFNSIVTNAQDFTNDKQLLIKAITSFYQLDDGRKVYDALMNSLNNIESKIDTNYTRGIIALSSGSDKGSYVTKTELIDKAIQVGIPIMIIFIGQIDNDLEEIATSTGGLTYGVALKPSDIIDLFNSLSAIFSTTIKPFINNVSPTSAKIGDIVTISGSGFGTAQGTSFLTFSGTNATDYQSWTDTEIKVKVQTGATTGKVSVTVNGVKSNEVDFTVNGGFVFGTMTDIDGNTYKTVKIGTQVWMAENLNVSHYRNGNLIRHCETATDWYDASVKKEGAWCYYDNDPANGAIYGKLFNWYAVNDPRGLAPTGWHVPSDAEWKILAIYLGGDIIAGGRMKETGTLHWQSPNTGATNESGFSALPGAYRHEDCTYYNIGYYGYLWSSTEDDATYVWVRELDYEYADIISGRIHKRNGISVRCIRD